MVNKYSFSPSALSYNQTNALQEDWFCLKHVITASPWEARMVH